MIEKWVNFKRDYLEISFLREKWVCAISPYHRRYVAISPQRAKVLPRGIISFFLIVSRIFWDQTCDVRVYGYKVT